MTDPVDNRTIVEDDENYGWLKDMSPAERLKDFYVYGGYEGFIAKAFMEQLLLRRNHLGQSELVGEMIAAASSAVNRVTSELIHNDFIERVGDEWLITDSGVVAHQAICT
jgi:hypothetical protein